LKYCSFSEEERSNKCYFYEGRCLCERYRCDVSVRSCNRLQCILRRRGIKVEVGYTNVVLGFTQRRVLTKKLSSYNAV